MSENSIPHTLHSFLADLVEIRKKNGITLDDIRVRTKVYPHIIAQFEENGLNKHPLFNVLYLKAFVRSYADVVGISPGIAARSYEDALGGKYDRRLAIEYLDHPAPDDIHASHAVESRPGKSNSRQENSIAFDTIGEKESSSTSFDLKVPTELRSSFEGVLSSGGTYFQKFIEFFGGKGILQWGVMAGVLVFGAFLLFKLVSVQNESMEAPLAQEPAQSIQETSVKDEGEADVISGIDSLSLQKRNFLQSVIDRIEQGDSLNVTIVATNGKLDPFRARVDRDLRRPYWLDEGDSLGFRFGEQITLEDNLDKMMLLFEGVEYAITETDSTARLVITRDSANAFMYSSLQ